MFGRRVVEGDVQEKGTERREKREEEAKTKFVEGRKEGKVTGKQQVKSGAGWVDKEVMKERGFAL